MSRFVEHILTGRTFEVCSQSDRGLIDAGIDCSIAVYDEIGEVHLIRSTMLRPTVYPLGGGVRPGSKA